MNTIYVRFEPQHIVRSENPRGINAVAEVCPIADDENLEVCVEDMTLGDRLFGERIMLHPESGYDFYQRGSYELTTDLMFDDLPLMGAASSRNLLTRDGPNATVITAGNGEISTPSFARIQELSVPSTSNPVSGRYHLSVIVKDHFEMVSTPPNDTTTVLFVHVETVTSWGDPRTITFSLPGSAFYRDTARGAAIHDSAFEYILGNLELRQPSNRLFFAPVSSFSSGWMDTSRFCGDKIVEAIGDSVAILSALDRFDIRIAAGSSNAKFLLDAVCLTNPGTMGLFNPDLHGVVSVHRAHRGYMLHRMEKIVHDTGFTRLPGLRMIGFPEQITRNACWLTSRLGRLLLNDVSSGSVLPYITTSAWTELTSVGTIHADFVSGAYYYPIFATHPRPTLNTTVPADYYNALMQPQREGFVEMGILLRTFVTQRNKFDPSLPWIPWIQNHSQLFATDPPFHWDGLSHREPTASELRQQCNTALALGARGAMFYTFASIPWKTDEPFWPIDTNQWQIDTVGGTPRALDPDMGMLGFLGKGNQPRIRDWNGENKWDSTRTFIHQHLGPVGDYMVQQDLRLRTHKFWHMTGPDAGTNEYVSMVFSERQDLPIPRDSLRHTWVQISEFEDKDQTKYLFVLNGRTHHEGHRHIAVKLAPMADPHEECVVENLFTGDIWVVRPSSSPDDSTKANGFTDYFRPGDAMLYRVRSTTTPEIFLPAQITGDLYVTPDATLSLVAGNDYTYYPESGVFVDGYFNANGTTFSASSETWLGIHARNDGSVCLENCTVDGGSIVVGSLGRVVLVNTRIEHVLHALYNVGGFLSSYGTTAPGCAYGYAWIDGPTTWLSNDESSADPTVLPWRTGIELLGSGSVDIHRTSLTEYVNGIVARDGLVSTDIAHRILPGRNLIDALSNILVADGPGRIDFGDSPGEYGTNNCFTLQNTVTGFHCYAAGGSIEAADSYWRSPTPRIFGNVNVTSPRSVCGVPFVDDQNREGLSKAAAPPPESLAARRALMQAFRDSNHALLRELVGSQLRAMRAGAPDKPLIQFLRFTVLRRQDLADLRDSLLIALLAHPGLDTKLDAADLLTDVRRFSEALEVLGAYSFDVSAALKKQYLKRRALYLPHAFRGGYFEGLQALDSLRIISDGDQGMEPLFRLYPLLYSGLDIDAFSQEIPKQSTTSGLWDRILPEGAEIESNYPNPFSKVTSFTFELGEEKHVRLSVYDAMGREVAVVTDADYQRGVHSVVLRGGDLPSGLYFYRLTTDDGVIQRKMLLMR